MARVQLNKVSYFGGHPAAGRQMNGLVLVVDDAGIHLRRLMEMFVIPWDEVASVDFEGPDQVGRRVTMTRMAAMGPLAFAAKKRTSDAYMHVETHQGYSVGFQVPKTSAGELRAKLGHWTSRLVPAPADAPAPPPQGPPAGWYADPDRTGARRWWDGTRWTEHTQVQDQPH